MEQTISWACIRIFNRYFYLCILVGFQHLFGCGIILRYAVATLLAAYISRCCDWRSRLTALNPTQGGKCTKAEESEGKSTEKREGKSRESRESSEEVSEAHCILR